MCRSRRRQPICTAMKCCAPGSSTSRLPHESERKIVYIALQISAGFSITLRLMIGNRAYHVRPLRGPLTPASLSCKRDKVPGGRRAIVNPAPNERTGAKAGSTDLPCMSVEGVARCTCRFRYIREPGSVAAPWRVRPAVCLRFLRPTGSSSASPERGSPISKIFEHEPTRNYFGPHHRRAGISHRVGRTSFIRQRKTWAVAMDAACTDSGSHIHRRARRQSADR